MNKEDQRKASKKALKICMEGYRAGRIFQAWVLGCYYRKSLENRVVISLVNMGQKAVKKSFEVLKKHLNQQKRRKEVFLYIKRKAADRVKIKVLVCWKKKLGDIRSAKKKLLLEWRKITEQSRREKKIIQLKTEVIRTGIEGITKKWIFQGWLTEIRTRLALKQKGLTGIKWFWQMMKKSKQIRKVKTEENIEETRNIVFLEWLSYVRKIKIGNQVYQRKIQRLFLQVLTENCKKSFTRNLFINKALSFYKIAVKKKVFSLLLEQKNKALAKKRNLFKAGVFHKTCVSKKYFKEVFKYKEYSLYKALITKKSFQFWEKNRISIGFNRIKFYFSYRSQKKLNLIQAKKLRIFDLQKENIIKWIEVSMQLKVKNDFIETNKSIEKQNKIYKIVQKFIHILKSKISKKAERPQQFMPKVKFVQQEEKIDFQYQPRKRPEPRRLVPIN